jgi:hypothetical protein
MCHPALVAVAMAASTGMQIVGQQQQAKQASEEASYKNAVLDNQRAVIQSDIQHESRQEDVRQALIAEEAAQATGRAEVQFASLGQQLAFGSSASDILADFAAESAFRAKVSAADSARLKRNFAIQQGNLLAEANLNTLRAEGAQTTANLQGLSAVAALGVQAGSTFEFTKAGKFAFRTRPLF